MGHIKATSSDCTIYLLGPYVGHFWAVFRQGLDILPYPSFGCQNDSNGIFAQ